MIRNFLCAAALALVAAGSSPAAAFDKYDYGHVWRLSFVKVNVGQSRDYLHNLDANYRRELDEAKREGVILSYKVLQSDDWTANDWTVILMLELPSTAAVEGFDERMDAVTDKVIGEQADRQGDVQRAKIRDYMTIRLAHEVLLK